MTEKERQAFNAIVESETDSYQRHFINALLKYNDAFRASINERCALPAVGRLWKES